MGAGRIERLAENSPGCAFGLAVVSGAPGKGATPPSASGELAQPGVEAGELHRRELNLSDLVERLRREVLVHEDVIRRLLERLAADGLELNDLRAVRDALTPPELADRPSIDLAASRGHGTGRRRRGRQGSGSGPPSSLHPAGEAPLGRCRGDHNRGRAVCRHRPGRRPVRPRSAHPRPLRRDLGPQGWDVRPRKPVAGTVDCGVEVDVRVWRGGVSSRLRDRRR